MTRLSNDAQLQASYTQKELVELIELKATIVAVEQAYTLPTGYKRMNKTQLVSIVRELDELLYPTKEEEYPKAQDLSVLAFENCIDRPIVLPVYLIHDNVYGAKEDASQYDDGKDSPKECFIVVIPTEIIDFGTQAEHYLFASIEEAEEAIQEGEFE